MVKLSLQNAQEKIDYFYENVITVKYTKHNNVLVLTKHGLCKISLANLKKGSKPSIRTALDKTYFFKSMLKERFPEHEKVFTIVGEFERSSIPITVKSKGMLYKIKPDILLKGALPHIKNSLCKTAHSIQDFNEVHNNKYSYPNFDYCGSSCLVPIVCEKHGEFKQKYYIHKMGSGCPSCADDNRVGGYSRSDFIKNAKGRVCTFYVIKCWNEEEEFYKIGITMRSVEERYKEVKRMPYKKETVHEYKNKDAGLIYDLEKKCLKKYKSLSYRPLIEFHGISECFNPSLPYLLVINKILGE